MKRVLVVDDDPTIRAALRYALERFEVLTARDGAEGLERLREARVDVVLLDLMMPVMDGPTFMQHLKALPDAPPVILLSAGRDLGQTATALGAVDYCAKPVSLDELEEKLNVLLQDPGSHLAS